MTVDAHQARAFLTERYGEVQDLQRFQRGDWSSAFGFRVGDEELVVRFGRYREDYEKDRVAARWSSQALPVPQVREIGEAFAGVYAISERCHGEPLETLSPPRWRAVQPSLLSTLDTMRDIELPGQGFGGWRRDGEAPYATWREFLLAIAGEVADTRLVGWHDELFADRDARRRFEQGYRALHQAVVGLPELRQVVHGDLTAGNVLVQGDAISAVFDWANSLAGDPLFDIGWLVFWSPWHPGIDVPHLCREVQRRWRDSDFEHRVRAYALHVGLDAQQYCAWSHNPELRRVSERTLELAGP